MEQQDSGRILRAIKRGSLLTVSRLTANYSIAALNELLINTDALLLASTNLAILSFLLDESQSSDSLPAAASLGIMGNKTLRVWREPSTHNSLLHVSATDGNLPVLATYLSRCPFTLELCNRSGQTALHLASQQGHLDCVRHLLSTGALPDLTDDGGNTALHYASQWNRPKVVDLLLQSGSNYGARNESGWMASDIAYDVSLQRHIESRVREMQEENRKAKARRRAQKEQQRNEQREREIRHVESEASLRSGASHSTTPGPTAVAAPGRPGYWPPPLRQDSINSPSIAAATTSIAVPSASSSAQTMSSGDVAASPSNTSTSDSSLPSHLQFAHGHGYDEIYGSSKARSRLDSMDHSSTSNGTNVTPLASASMFDPSSSSVVDDPPLQPPPSLNTKTRAHHQSTASGASASGAASIFSKSAASKLGFPFGHRHRTES